MTHLRRQADGWGLDGIAGPPGVSLFEHVGGLLPASGRGPLPAGGEPLPDERDYGPDEVRFAPGVQDAVIADTEAGQGPIAAAAALLELLKAPPTGSAMQAVLDRLGELSGPDDVDRLLTSVADGKPSRERLATTARWLCLNGTTRQVVKAGIALLGVSGTEDDAELIIRLGLLEELTLYALVALQNLVAEPERLIFDLGQQVSGWGRIHAVERLRETSDDEIRRWLLYGGYENDVMIEYTAFVAATTGGLRHALETSAQDDDDLLDHAGAILYALCLGGPAESLSDYTDSAVVLADYLDRLDRAEATVTRLHQLVRVNLYLGDDEDENLHIDPAARERLQDHASAILGKKDWVDLVRTTLESDDLQVVSSVLTVAGWVEVPTEPVLWKWLRREPLASFLWYLLADDATREDAQALSEAAAELLPMERLASGPERNLGFGADYEADECLGYVVQGLKDHPGEGWPIIATALRNRVTRNRNLAVRVLVRWPRQQWPQKAEPLLQEAFWTEPDENVRALIRGAIDGQPLPD